MIISTALLLLLFTPRELPTPAQFEPATVHSLERGFAAGVAGTVYNTNESPIEGARITVYQVSPGWNGGNHILRQGFTDQDGSFTLGDLQFRSGNTFVQIVGGENDLTQTIPLALATDSTVQLGEVRLATSCVLEGVIDGLQQNKKGRHYADLFPQGSTQAKTRAPIESGRFRLQGFEPGAYDLSLQLGDQVYSNVVVVKEETPRMRIGITLKKSAASMASETFGIAPPVSDLDEALGTPQLSFEHKPLQGDPPVAGREPTLPHQTLTGSLHDKEGNALVGYRIVATPQWGRVMQTDPGSRTMTDANGDFALNVTEFDPVRFWVMGPHGSTTVVFKADRYSSKAIVADPTKPMHLTLDVNRIVLPETTQSPTSSGPVPVQYSVYGSSGWVPVSAQVAGERLGIKERKLLVEIPGHLPRIASLANPIEHHLRDLHDEQPMGLRVRAHGKPVEGTRIYLEQNMPEQWDWHGFVVLGEFPLDNHGMLQGLAHPNSNYMALIIAPGYTPKRVHLYGEDIVNVELEPHANQVRIGDLQPGQIAYLSPSGSTRPVWTWRYQKGPAPEVHLGIGAFDLLVTNILGVPVAGQSFEVESEQGVLALDASNDARSSLILQLPEPPPMTASTKEWAARNGGPVPERSPWCASAMRGANAGGSFGAAAISSAGAGQGSLLPTASVQYLDERTLKFLFHGTGTYRIKVEDAYGIHPNNMFHEVLVAPGSNQELTLPPLNASLKGSMRAFNADSGYSHHGFAGPRLWIGSPAVAGRRVGWSAECYFPSRLAESEPEFIAASLPAGEYWVQDHLSESGTASWGERRRTHSGALVVQLDEGKNTIIKDFADYPEYELQVTVRHADGRPFAEGALTNQDPMSDAWQAFKRIPTTGVYADAHIPVPKRFRLDQLGKTTMKSMKYGAAILILKAEAGWEMTTSVQDLIHEDGKATFTWILPNDLPQ